VAIRYHTELAFDYGRVDRVAPLIRRVIARNPSPFTFHGTGTYIVGDGEVAVIDPGPALASHVSALLAAVAGERVTHILITHTHLDHSPAAAALKAATGAPTCGFGAHGGRPDAAPVEEGADYDFRPDCVIGDGAVVSGPGWTIQAVHTPGHTSNHLCLALREQRALFSGDHVMGWSTTVISPPDGDMKAYLASLEKLLARDDRVYWPTHGPSIPEPKAFVRALIDHRHQREAAIRHCLEQGIDRIPAMVAVIYAAIDRRLHAAAARSVLAHLIHMVESGRVDCDGAPAETSVYRLPR